MNIQYPKSPLPPLTIVKLPYGQSDPPGPDVGCGGGVAATDTVADDMNTVITKRRRKAIPAITDKPPRRFPAANRRIIFCNLDTFLSRMSTISKTAPLRPFWICLRRKRIAINVLQRTSPFPLTKVLFSGFKGEVRHRKVRRDFPFHITIKNVKVPQAIKDSPRFWGG